MWSSRCCMTLAKRWTFSGGGAAILNPIGRDYWMLRVRPVQTYFYAAT
jgi:hypothetical protein